jgi:branched-subunit amino acid aminotransferase/4-amino-4-deoxychorismate lyase
MTAIEALALTNYGHFTTMRVEDGRVRGLGLHLDRLVRDCVTLFDAQLSAEHVRERIRHAVAGTRAPLTVRVTVFDPALPLSRPAAPADPQVLVTTRAATPERLPALRVRATRYVRDLPAVKHTGLLGPLHQRRRAQLDGYDDALFTDADGLVSEGVTWNIGFFDGESLVLPAAEVLPGVTMALLRDTHDGPVRTEPIGPARLGGMQMAFATNAAGGVRAIRSVGRTVWPAEHPVLDQLRAAYARVEPDRL